MPLSIRILSENHIKTLFFLHLLVLSRHADDTDCISAFEPLLAVNQIQWRRLDFIWFSHTFEETQRHHENKLLHNKDSLKYISLNLIVM